MTLPALTIKCECQECRRFRRDMAQQANYYLNYGTTGIPQWVYSSGLDSVSADEPMCEGGCGTHSSCADAGMQCIHCGSCDSVCYCEKCSNCGGLSDECSCCDNCGSSYCGSCGNCDESECECCCESEDCDSDGGGNGFGSFSTAPWSARGYIAPTNVDYRTWSEVWNVDRSIDLSQSAADFYLLSALKSPGIIGPCGYDTALNDSFLAVLRTEASGLLTALVAKLDRSFIGYVDAIIGGELRHHRASGSLKRHGRKDAWLEWHSIREKVGVDALSDAVGMFEDFNSGGYGGRPWADITRSLIRRVSGQVTPAHFIDEVFHLQHCGGSIFDKGSWSSANRLGWGYYELNNWVLPAHGREPESAWTLLLAVASDEVRELFSAMWRASNHAARMSGGTAVRCPSASLPHTSRYDSYYCRTIREMDTDAMCQMLANVSTFA